MAQYYSRLIGSGSVLPKRVVTNDDLAKELAKIGVETSDEWISTRTGIKQRYIVSGDEDTVGLATTAAQRAIQDAGIQPSDIDLIVVGTTSGDQIFPSTACLVQDRLGISGGAAFDVQAVCSGFVYAITTADNFIRAGSAKCALVIGAESFSRLLDWKERSTCVLFGDGAGAMVLKASSEPGIMATELHAEGSLNTILNVPGGIRSAQVVGDPFLRMDGQAVFKKAVSVLEQSARNACKKAGVTIDQIDWFIPHQANARIIQFVGKKLGIPDERVILTVDQHANTSAASVPLAYDWARKQGLIKDGQTLLLQGVGGGFTWGSIVVKVG